MLTAYMDESGHSKDPRSHFVGMGGLVAECCAWEKLDAAWKATLADFGIDGAFHMKDFAHRTGEFKKGWNEPRRQKLFGRLVGAIVESQAVPVGCVVSLDDYNAAPAILKTHFQDPYFMAFQIVTRGAAVQALPKTYPFEPESVAMVYAYQEEFGATAPTEREEQAGQAQRLFRAMKRLTIYGQYMGSYECDSPSNRSPLQAADLFAYELTKEFENQLTRPDDKMRWALREILRPTVKDGGHHLIQFFDGHEMVRVFIESTGQESRPDLQDILTHSWLRQLAARTVMEKRIAELGNEPQK